MLLRETGFTFDGIHSRTDMGLIYAEKDGHVFIPKIERNEYEIAGQSGSVLMDGETFGTITFEGTLYPAVERPTQAQAQQLLRGVAAWLTAGRKRLIFDYEPGVYYLAQLSDKSKWSLKNWFGGEIPVKFEAQPFAYAVDETSVTAEKTTAGLTMQLKLVTGRPAPLRILIENTGTATIDRVRIKSQTTGPDFRDLALAPGQALRIDFETPIGAVIEEEGQEPVNALPKAARFPILTAQNGTNNLPIWLTHGDGDKGETVTVSARARW